MLTNGPNLGLLVDGDAGEEHYDELMAQFRGFDALIQCNVLSATTTAEPGAPADGDSYIVPVGATGTEWAGEDGKVARWSDKESAWEFYTPREGWQAYSEDDNAQYLHDGADWVLAYIVGEVANISTTEFTMWLPDDRTFMVGLPTDISLALLGTNDRARIGTRLSLIRAAAQPTFTSVRVNGTLDTPTALVSGDIISAFRFGGYDGAASTTEDLIRVRATQNWTSGGDHGMKWELRVVDDSAPTSKGVLEIRSGGVNVCEILSIQNTYRFIPGSVGHTWRDSSNAADTMTLNAAGTTFAIPLATSLTFASATAFVVGVDPGGTGVFRVGGDLGASGYQLMGNAGGGRTIFRSVSDGLITITGGTSTASGSNLRLYGATHATQAKDIELRSDGTVKLFWDDSAALWTASAPFNVNDAGGLQVSGSKVVGIRKTGWGIPTGALTRTTYDTATVTLPQLAERVAALINDLHSAGAAASHALLTT